VRLTAPASKDRKARHPRVGASRSHHQPLHRDCTPDLPASDGVTDRSSPPGELSLPILRQFCEELVAEAVASVREVYPGTEPPEMDWGRLWVSESASSPEIAAGHAAVAAQRMASDILTWKQSIIGSGVLSTVPRFAPASQGFVEARVAPPTFSPRRSPPLGEPAGSPSSQGVETGSSRQASAPIDPIPPRQDKDEPHTAPTIGVDQKLKRNRRLRRAFVAFGWMRDIGLILIAFAAWQLWGTSIEQSQAQQTLRQQFESHLPTAAPQTASKSTGPTLISAAINVPAPPDGSAVGLLQIPAIGVDQYVVQGTSESDLAKGPGHYIGTSMPGQAGNISIAGHRTTYGAPFYNLNNLKIGDQISLTSNAGEQLTYVVSANPVAVSPNDVAVLNPVGDNRLTLTTCNPRFSSSQRLVVVAELNEPHTVAAAPPNIKPRPVRIVNEPIGWNTGYIPIVLLLAALLIGLGLANRRARNIYGRTGRWLVLTPIWVAGLFFLFESLTRLLPANL